MTRSLDEQFADISRRGLRLASLFEKTGGGWRASLAPAADHKAPWVNGEGKTAHEAIARAMSKAPTRAPSTDDDIL